MAEKIILTSGKRRTAVARARLVKLKAKEGSVRINGVPIEQIEPKMARLKMMEPIILLRDIYKNDLGIKVRISGGGMISQAEAVRMAIARGLLKYLGLNEVREIYENYDRTMIAGDVRRTESKKYGGPGARARYQKSYR